MTDWPSGRLIHVLVPTDERAGTGAGIDLVLSVTEKRGIIPQTEVYQKRVATEDVSKYKILRPLDVAYNPYLLWTNAVGQWLGTVPGVTSPVYECFRAREGQEPRYWGLVLESGLLTPYFDATAVGSVQRRRRTTVPTFLAAAVEIPPLEVQRRIVDLISAVDDQIARLDAESKALNTAAGARRSLFPTADEVPLGAVLQGIDSGRSLGLNGADAHPTMRVLMLSAVRPAVYHPLEVKPLPADAFMPDDALVREGDLLITRSNTPERVGYACRARGVQPGTFMPDLIWRLRVTPSCDAEYLEQALASPLMRARVSGSAGGTSQSMRKINKAGLMALPIPLPTLDEQREYAANCSALAAQSQCLAHEAECLTTFRGQLLSDLLSNDVEVPEAYDRLVDAGVA